MLGRHLDAGHRLVTGEKGDLVAGRGVQNMDPRAHAFGQGDQPAGGANRGFGVSHLRMAGPVAGASQRPPLDEPRLVLGVKGGAAADGPQNGFDAGVVGDQQGAGRGAHEHLHPAAAGQPLELGQFGGVLVGRADVERMVAVHPAARPGQLVAQSRGGGGRRLGVGHLEDRGDAAQDGGPRSGLQVFLPRRAGLAEVDLGVDHAGQDGQAGGGEDLAGGGLGEIADGRDLAAPDPDIGQAAAGMVDHLAAPDEEVETLRHEPSLPCCPRAAVPPCQGRWRRPGPSCGRSAG